MIFKDPPFDYLSESTRIREMVDPNAAVQLAGVTLQHDGRRTALDDISCSINPGEFVFLVGATGSGKSSFLKLLTREFRPTQGQVCVFGRDITDLKASMVPLLRRQMGVVFQDFRLLKDRTVFENVAFALRVIGVPSREIGPRVFNALRRVGLAAASKKFPGEISGGEQQRAAVARAIVNEPKMLLADEPTGNLDPDTSWEIMDLLRTINQSGATVVMATHNSAIVDDFRKRVIQLRNGRIVRDERRGAYSEQRNCTLYPG